MGGEVGMEGAEAVGGKYTQQKRKKGRTGRYGGSGRTVDYRGTMLRVTGSPQLCPQFSIRQQ